MTEALLLLFGFAAGAVIGGIYAYRWGHEDGFGMRDELPQTWVAMDDLQRLILDDDTMAAKEDE